MAVSNTLLASALFAFVTSAIYVFVGYRLSRRAVPMSGRLAAVGFVAFWYGLAASNFLGQNGLQALLAAFGYLNLYLTLALGQISLVAICVALWGILYYLVYLYTGRRRAWVPLAWFYSAFYVFLEYFIWDSKPIDVQAEDWRVKTEYVKAVEGPEALSNPIVLALVIGLLVPQILAALAYLSLVFRAQTATQRYRILLVSISILVWFGAPFFALGRGVQESTTYQVVSRFIGLGAALAIFLAYHPPGWIRRRYGILGLSDEPATSVPERQEAPPPPPSERMGRLPHGLAAA